jgi:NAD(P) transhydrogenase subunit alpha
MSCSFQNLADSVELFVQMDSGASSALGVHGFTVFILACFVGYYVVWMVTPALHAPLMAVTNAVSSVIIVGAIFAAAQSTSQISKICGFVAIVLVSINIFGGFAVTHRMLNMFRKR